MGWRERTEKQRWETEEVREGEEERGTEEKLALRSEQRERVL